MGQQQLLLLVLGAIIVGAAILIGINMFSGSSFQANQDAVQQDCLMIVGRLQQYYRKPVALGGGGHTFPATISFQTIGILENSPLPGVSTTTPTDTDWKNEHGKFTIAGLTTSATVTAITGEFTKGATADVRKTIMYTITPTSVTNGGWGDYSGTDY
ncbi:MAG: hypothetical protein JXB00_07825 [Bacteroidales bacterium]|nr:hypothetical protein [Bacteroidales bacterium]